MAVVRPAALRAQAVRDVSLNNRRHPVPQQVRELVGGHGPAEEVALSLRAAPGSQEGELFLGFDALGNDTLLEVLTHINDGADDGRIVRVAGDLVDKGLVNLEDVDGELAEIAEAGIAGAEVVHSQVYTHPFEGLKHIGGSLDVAHQDALGELKVEIAGFQAGFRENRADALDKTLIAKLDSGNIDGNALERQTRVLPFAGLSAGFIEYPSADLDNEAALYGDGNELGGKDASTVGVLPTHQGFGAGDLTGVEIDLRLKVQQELVALQSAAQAAFEVLPVH